MSDEQDRVLLRSDLRALESGLVERISSESEKLRQQFDGGLMSRTPRTSPAEIARLRALARGNNEVPAWREELSRHAEGVLVRQHEDLTPRVETLIRSLDIAKAEAERRIEERERHYRACIIKIWRTE
jgi:hypothetical protein